MHFLFFSCIKDQLNGKEHQIKLEYFCINSLTQNKDVVECLARRSAQHHQDITGTAGENPLECNMILLAATSNLNFGSFPSNR